MRSEKEDSGLSTAGYMKEVNPRRLGMIGNGYLEGWRGGGNGEKVRKVHWLVPHVSAEKPLMATQPYKAGFGF